jgi:hypothetical protein
MTREKLLEDLKEALRLNTLLYDKLGNGDYKYSRAGQVYDQRVGYPTIQALKNAINELEEK